MVEYDGKQKNIQINHKNQNQNLIRDDSKNINSKRWRQNQNLIGETLKNVKLACKNKEISMET